MAPWNRRFHPTTIWLLLFLLFATTSQALEVDLSPPPLYTGDFGDCYAGHSQLAVSRFDLAYDAGNRTFVLHLDGASKAKFESVELRIFINAYGTPRLDMTVDPCGHNITSLCTVKPDVPVSAHAEIPVKNARAIDNLLSGFPYDLPDFEGTAILRIYAKTPNRVEIGCVQAALTNGQSLSHPEIIAPVLGAFTLAALAASFLTAIYGVNTSYMRMHHAHSLSAVLVFQTFQTIFFSGLFSVDWPPLLAAWWSNFAWSAGFIYIAGLVRAINHFTGVTGVVSQIAVTTAKVARRATAEQGLDKDTEVIVYNSTFLAEYYWSGKPVDAGIPLPGTGSGFAATLAAVNIPFADAFLVSLIWLLVAVGLIALAITAFKFLLEGLASAGKIHPERLACFRARWTGYLGHAMLRTLVAAFFMIVTLAMLQFTILDPIGPVAVAIAVFVVAVIGIVFLAAVGCRARTRDGRFHFEVDRLVFYPTKVGKKIPGVGAAWEASLREYAVDVRPLFTVPMYRIRHLNADPDRPSVHLDEPFVKRFGWLTARYRRTRWWFLTYHVTYLLCRAAFLGGGWQSPHTQVYGVLVFDIINFLVAVVLAPYESDRNNAMGVWILGICNIFTSGAATAYLPGSNYDRADAARLAIGIVVIQSLTVLALAILIILSCIATWISLMRNRQELDPDWMEPVRSRYSMAMELKAQDVPFGDETDSAPPTPQFSVGAIQRRPKIEDEDEDATMYQHDLDHGPFHRILISAAHPNNDDDDDDSSSHLAVHPHAPHSNCESRASSTFAHPRLSTGSLPRAARPYRASWSSREFGDSSAAAAAVALSRPSSVVTKRLSGITCVVTDCCDAPPSSTSSSTALVRPLRPQSESTWSLGGGGGNSGTPSASRASSPAPARLSRETVRLSREVVAGEYHGDGRRPPTALPEAPEPLE
ncbi:hypothetical protein C8A05DRAFT_31215 [Staphylotrichum tortipilum]|uniref:ML-like domain-containing protein n=1 Tax=Staphylotrichum tortipilum TaxID=2831512 RepID=A0AAN6MRB0_9PEZI|nr:hypothetical protein C8A05DRAFT_31215 [Staphylotrichum longicolle]